MRRVRLFAAALVVWLLLVWPVAPSGGVDWQSVAAGVLVAAAIAALVRVPVDPGPGMRPAGALWMVVYLPVFFWYCLLANLDVVYRVVHPALPIRPGIVKVRTQLSSPAGVTALANSITLTPGTLTVDVGSDGEMFVHWINVTSTDVEGATAAIVGRFERFLRRIFR